MTISFKYYLLFHNLCNLNSKLIRKIDLIKNIIYIELIIISSSNVVY